MAESKQPRVVNPVALSIAVETALERGKEGEADRKVLAKYIEGQNGGFPTPVSIALESTNQELRNLVAKTLRRENGTEQYNTLEGIGQYLRDREV